MTTGPKRTPLTDLEKKLSRESWERLQSPSWMRRNSAFHRGNQERFGVPRGLGTQNFGMDFDTPEYANTKLGLERDNA